MNKLLQDIKYELQRQALGAPVDKPRVVALIDRINADTRLPEVAELIEALRPLAMLGGPDDGCAAAFHDIEDDTLVYENSGKCITAGDVRAARKLVSRYAQPIATAERMRSPRGMFPQEKP